MNNNKLVFFVILLLLFPLLYTQQDDIIKEKVDVTNVEIPVRVKYKGKVVDNLTRNDFTILEGKKKQSINGFFIKRRKIGLLNAQAATDLEQSSKGRYFVLIFRTTNYNDDFKKGLEHLFDNVIMESDQLLVIVNKKSQVFHNLQEKNTVKQDIERFIKNESHYERTAQFQYIKQIEQELNMTKFETAVRRSGATARGVDSTHYTIKDFLTKYLMAWNDYKTKYLIPDIEQYRQFSRILERIPRDKWVINFFQMELYPQIMIPNDIKRMLRSLISDWQIRTNQEFVTFARIINKLLTEIDRAQKTSNDFPSNEVSAIFSKVSAIFHTIFIRTTLPSLRQDSDYLHKAADLESNLHEICRKTGGLLVNSRKIDLALDAISKEPDVYYLLTYAPLNPEKVGKIKVKVKKKRHKVFFDEYLRAGSQTAEKAMEVVKGPPVKIKDASFQNKQLSLTLTSFHLKKNLGGKLSIRIRINNRQDITVFDQKKDLNAKQKQITLSLNFAGIGKGRYNIIIDVKDLFTQKSDSEIIQINME